MISNKAYTPTDGLKNKVSFPTFPVSEDAWRKQFQDMFDQIPVMINDILAVLHSKTDNSSGSDEINATPITGLGDSNTDTVQKILESLKTLVDTKSNSTDIYTQTQLNNGQLDTRYFTETEIQNTYATITALQDVVLGAIPNDTLTNLKLVSDIKIGSLASLNTTDKASVTNAINEVLTTLIPKSILTTQGDLIGSSAANTPVRIPKGTALQYLRMNAGATGQEYATLPTGAQVTSGTYTGDGTTSKSVNIGFTPKYVLIYNTSGVFSTITNVGIFASNTFQTSASIIIANGFSVSTTTTNINSNGIVYNYVAIG